MSRAAILLAALAACAAGCGNRTTPAATGQLRQPSAVAAFVGYTFQNAGQLAPYLAIANTDRNDLTLLSAVDDSIVKAPVQLRPLAVPVSSPALLASTSLEGEPTPGAAPRPDLLVAVGAGDSTLQVIRTWAADNAVAATVALPGDVLALAAIPSPAGTARIAAALSGRQLAVVHFRRVQDDPNDAIEPAPLTAGGPPFAVQPLGFEAVSLATVPGDVAHVYAASLEPIGPGAVLGAAEVDVSADAGPWPVRALGARGATRLVTAASLAGERRADATETNAAAFALGRVTRVYAVLDEGSCGPDRAIDCGIVALDPALDTAARGHSIPDDFPTATGERWMPYRAPIREPGRPLAFVAARPPLVGPPENPELNGAFMRYVAGATTWATTAVGAVAMSTSALQFVDLGRYRQASSLNVPQATRPSVTLPTTDNRLWVQDAPGHFVESTTDLATAGAAAIGVTPGYTPDEGWTIAYQGGLPGLIQRLADAGTDGTGSTWLAVQVGGPGPIGAGRTVSQVARLWHPSLGVHDGDIVVVRASSVGGDCKGTVPPGTTPANEATTPTQFEVSVTGLFPPDAGRPGGYVTIGERVRLPEEPVETDPRWGAWRTCFKALTTKIAQTPGGVATQLVASFQARELVLIGGVLGYAGRPAFGEPYALQYRASSSAPDEDALAAACPLADWDGSLPPPDCGGTCDRAVCENLVLARKARRVHHVAESCGDDAACLARFPPAQFPLPVVNGPAIAFRVDQQIVKGTDRDRVRNTLQLRMGTASGSQPLSTPGGTVSLAGGATTFDRSPWGTDGSGGYRFYVSYPAGQVVDAYPGVNPVSNTVVR